MNKDSLRTMIAALAIVAFAVVWLIACWWVFDFNPTEKHPKQEFDPFFVTVAGLLGSGVATGTAAYLGITIAKNDPLLDSVNRWARLKSNLTSANLLSAGVVIYGAIGLLALLVTLTNSATAPKEIQAFALVWVGWVVGAFAVAASAK